MRGVESPGWLPLSMRILAYHVDPGDVREPSIIFEKLIQKYGAELERDSSLNIETESAQIYVKYLIEKEGQVVLLAARSSEGEGGSYESISAYDNYNDRLDNVYDTLTGVPIAVYSIRFAYAIDEKKAKDFLQEYLNNSKSKGKSAGIIRNIIMVTLNRVETITPKPSREILVVHCGNAGRAVDDVWNFSHELCHLALYMGKMYQLFLERSLMFDQMDASESNTQIWINDILAKMRRPVDEIQPTDLEDILKEITIQFSRLSTLVGSMRRDKVKAGDLHRSLLNLLKTWGEKPLEDYLTNSVVDIGMFENMMAPFSDFIERTEALMTQLNTVLDSVRTYLGIKQQKISIQEEMSSKEQLIRLVSLQETLHKLEVIIVAVYLTEMARIIFEAVMHEHVHILTALFVPIALVISVIIGRLLHKEH